MANKFAEAIKKALGGKGGLNVDATGLASETTLSQIYEVLVGIVQAMGGKVIRDPEKDKLLARKRELLAEKARVGNKVDSDKSANRTNKSGGSTETNIDAQKPLWDDVNKVAKAEFAKAKESGKTLAEIINDIVSDIKNKTIEGSRDRVIKQVELQKALSAAFNFYKENGEFKPFVNEKGEEKYRYEDLAKLLGIGDDYKLRMTKGQVEKLDGFTATAEAVTQETNEQLENEKTATAESEKRVENEKKASSTIDAGRSKKDISNEFWKTVPTYNPQTETLDTLKQKASALKGELDTMYDEGKKDTVEFIQKQTELSRVLSLMRSKYSKEHPEVYGTKGDATSQQTANDAWQKYLLDNGILKNLDNVSLTSILRGQFNQMVKPFVEQAREEERARLDAEKPEEIKIKDFEDFKTQVQNLVKTIGEQEGNAEEQRKSQEQLIEVLRAWAKTDPSKIGGVIKDDHTMPTAKEWEDYLIKEKVLESVDTKKTPLTNKQLNKSASPKEEATVAQQKADAKKEEAKAATEVAQATKEEAAATEHITEDKKEQKAIEGTFSKEKEDELRDIDKKLGDYSGPQVDFSEADIGLAKEETLEAILRLLENIKTEGIKKGGSGTRKKKNTEYDNALAIQRKALINKESIDAMTGSSGALVKYHDLEKELDNAVKLVEADVKAKAKFESGSEAQKNMDSVKRLAQQISALGFNIMKDASSVEYRLAEGRQLATKANFGQIKSGKDWVFDRNKLKADMIELAKDNAEAMGAAKPLKDSDFNFDGTTLTYQLVNMKGEIEKITMEWSEFSNIVGITSDKSVTKLDTLASKVDNLSGKFKNAIDMGYLNVNSEKYKAFLERVAAIDKETTFDGIEEARNRAIQAADAVNKEISQNKKLYTGTTEMNAAERQYKNLESRGIFDNVDFTVFKRYQDAYDQILKTHSKWQAMDGGKGLLRPEAQKKLRKHALEAQVLGKQLEKSVAEAEQLKQLVASSGIYNGKQMGGIQQITLGTQNLEAAMRSYLQSLGLGNIEHIKYDHTHQRLTGTLRTSKTAVSDLEVKYNEATKSLYAYTKAERESLTGLPAFLNGFQKKFNSIMQYLTMTMSIHQVISELRRGIQYIREIDLALTELRKVTSGTKQEYEAFLQTASKTGERLGSTISAVTEATATFAKLGFSMQQASEMAESAIVYKNVGDNIASTEDAADSIISTLKGFGMEASESMAIVDKFNEVGNRFAITSQGIGEALRLSASALNEGKNSLDESIALITAANEVVRFMPRSHSNMVTRSDLKRGNS